MSHAAAEQGIGAGRVVVGISEALESLAAVRWGARHAEENGLDLLLVHARQVPMPGPAAMHVMTYDRAPGNPAWVDAVATEVRAEHPAVDVATTVLTGPPAHTLMRAAEGAAVLVIGSRGERSLQAALLSGISERLAAETPCPLIIVPVGEGFGDDASQAPVLLATDLSTDSEPATKFAFEVAHSTRRPLCALTAANPQMLRLQSFVQLPPDDVILDHADDALRESLAPFRNAHPDVRVTTRVVSGDPVAQIRRAARDAWLVVVGSRGQGFLRGTFFGSTSRDTLRAAPGPAAVVRSAT